MRAFADGFGTHLGDEGIGAVFVFGFAIVRFREQAGLSFERGVARIGDDVIFVVDHALQGRAVMSSMRPMREARHALEEPDVGDGHGELDVAHALAADAG